jgi:hypothetical protein
MPIFWRMPRDLHDADLLAHAARVVPDRPPEGPLRQLERVAQGRAPDRGPPGERREVVEVADAREVVVERDAAWQVPHAPPDCDGRPHDIQVEDRRGAGRRVQVPQQQPDERALAGAVRAQEAEDLALPDLERQVVEGADGPVVLRQAAGGDGAHGQPRSPKTRTATGRPAARGSGPVVRGPWALDVCMEG